MNSVFLSIGTNIGDKLKNIILALYFLSKLKYTKIIKISPIYQTSPIGFLEQNDFYNCCIKIETNFTPLHLLKKLKKIEKKMGRKKNLRNGPRVIDIDIIFFNQDNYNYSEKLTIPHKEWKNRAFVLTPLSDIIDNNSKYRDEIKTYIKNIDPNQKIMLTHYL